MPIRRPTLSACAGLAAKCRARCWPTLASPTLARWRRTLVLILAGGTLGAAWNYRTEARHLQTMVPPAILPPLKRAVAMQRGSLFAAPAQAAMAPSTCAEAALTAFLPRRSDLLSSVRAFLGSTWSVDAYVVPGLDTLFVTRPIERLSDTVFAHEWTHIIQDQYLDLTRRYAARRWWDEKLALTATIEAVAHLVARDGAGAQQTAYSADWESNAATLVHHESTRWLRSRWTDYPLTTTANAPSGTYAILYPEAPRVRATPPTMGANDACVDRLGPLAVMTAIYRASRDPALAEAAGRSWRGDVVRLSTGDPARLTWHPTWRRDVPSAIPALWHGVVPDSGISLPSARARTP